MPHALPSPPVAPVEAGPPWSRRRAGPTPAGPTLAGAFLAGALLDGSLRTGDVPEAARVLGLPERGRYAVVAVAAGEAAERVAWHAVVVPADLTCRWHLGARADHGIVLLDDGDAALDRLARGAAAHHPPRSVLGPVRAGVGLPVDGLGALDVARRHADVALAVCPRATVVRLHEHLPAALVQAGPDLAAALAARVLGPLLRLPAPERDVLLGTLAVWLEGDGATPQAARRLGCHRNTVRNRLLRCERLTGRSLARPADVVEVGLALSALRFAPSYGDEGSASIQSSTAAR